MRPVPLEIPRGERMQPADYGWLALTAGVIAWNALAPECLSSGVDRYLNSRARHLVIGAVAVTGAHLLNILPQSVDPLYQGFDALRKLTGREPM